MRRGKGVLYDLKNDPFELHDLAADPEHRTNLDHLRTKLEAWMQETHDQGGTLEDPKDVQKEMELLAKSVQRMRAELGLDMPAGEKRLPNPAR